MRILHVVGARPNFMKAAPVLRALAGRGVEQFLVHTGQHYDAAMSAVFFDELDLPRPDVDLEVGSGSHAWQTAEVMKRIEPVILERRADALLVYGDVNSTVAAAMVACKLGVPVAHVEAGLRSFDRTMPEEINRAITDQISDLLLTHSPEAADNLAREGVDASRVHLVGNVMIDTLVRLLPRARAGHVLETRGLRTDGAVSPFVLATIHRPSNVDEPDRLTRVMRALAEVGKACEVVFPLHPRTRSRLADFDVDVEEGRVHLVDPLGYLDFLCLEDAAAAVITDSGGIQEETTYLGVPCFTVRPNTERPITISQGTNRLVGDNLEQLAALVRECLTPTRAAVHPPPLWDGRAAERIAEVAIVRYG